MPSTDQTPPDGPYNLVIAEQISRLGNVIDSYARQQQAETSKASAHNRKILRWMRAATIGAIAYTIATGVILVLTVKSIGEAQRAATAATEQAKAAADTEKRQLRAYVFLATAVMRDFVSGKRPNARVEVKNSGQTPAYSVVFDIGISLGGLPNPGVFNDPGHPSAPSPIGPGISLYPVGTANNPLDDPTIDSIKTGKAAYFVYGTIRYEDAFGQDHWTKMRWVFGVSELLDGSGAMSIDREGNDADR